MDSSGSPDQVELKISRGEWSIARHIDVADCSRLVIRFEEDDFGGLCPRIGLKTEELVHSDGRAAVTVRNNDCVVVLPPPRYEGRPTATAAGRGQQQSAARAQRARDTGTGTGGSAPKATEPSRNRATRVAGGSSGTSGNGRTVSRQSGPQRPKGQLREAANRRGFAMRVAARESVMVAEPERAPAIAENAATEITQLRAQVKQLERQLRAKEEQAHRDRVISQGLLDAQPGLKAYTAAGRKQDVPAEDKLSRANEKLTARVKELSVQVQQLQVQPETVDEQTQCDSRITGISRNSIGVEKNLHARQQGELKDHRKDRNLAAQRKVGSDAKSRFETKAEAEAAVEAATAATAAAVKAATAAKATAAAAAGEKCLGLREHLFCTAEKTEWAAAEAKYNESYAVARLEVVEAEEEFIYSIGDEVEAEYPLQSATSGWYPVTITDRRMSDKGERYDIRYPYYGSDRNPTRNWPLNNWTADYLRPRAVDESDKNGTQAVEARMEQDHE